MQRLQDAIATDTAGVTTDASCFHIVFIGIALTKFSRVLAHVQAECGYRVSHIVTTTRDRDLLVADGVSPADIYVIHPHRVNPRPTPDEIADLANLERPDLPTIHNVIMADPFAKRLPYTDAIAYGVHLARGFRTLYRRLQPSVVVGGHDRMHAAIAGAVARQEGVPWFVLNFSVLPVGYVAVSPRLVPDEMVYLRERRPDDLDEVAARLLEEFEQRRLRAPVYVSSYSIGLVVRRLRSHARELVRLLKAQYGRSFDKYNEPPTWFMVRQYLRKRLNLLQFPKEWFITEPTSEPFVFFGLHMQPESSVDVYAPFYASQFDVIEKIARAIPPTHRLLVKLHLSDADNYSRRQLRRLRQLPGVMLVAPTAWSRPFLERCAAVVTIAGTMGLEGALLGKPVVTFGTMNYSNFPTVARVGNLNELPMLIRRQLNTPHPGRQAILEAYRNFLNTYICATGPNTKAQLDDWTHTTPSLEELDGFVELFRSLESFLHRA